jgi:26S proteasome regulatory subunit N5
VDLIHRLQNLKDIEKTTVFHHALNLFSTKEIISLPFSNQDVLEKHSCLGRFRGEEAMKHYVALLQTRVIQQNLRTLSFYYKRIRCSRIVELLGLSNDELDNHLGELSSSGDAYVKIDRPAGIVCFGEPKLPTTILSDWSSDIGKMLNLMESTCHLINRENMVHKV